MIYLISMRDAGLCKIGYAVNPQDRLAGLATASPFDLELLATREGDTLLERALHRQASAHHVKREWFKLCPEVVAIFETGERDQTLVDYSNIVRSAGRPEEVALALGVSAHTVRSWIQRGSVPKNQWQSFVTKGYATFEELAAAEVRSAQDRAA